MFIFITHQMKPGVFMFTSLNFEFFIKSLSFSFDLHGIFDSYYKDREFIEFSLKLFKLYPWVIFLELKAEILILFHN